ncbi:TonB-dependent receptor [Pseudopedobacter saltans DSM 12145]|uniref:TonB-dependent receptor n=1 Tax=Pseudopedobacter saltans (strain ATCC 51119 / DSM 12145 / JCM 21818 / CCUG 39354 / LMG 10337 / NBRC 100064 / NCIMB 13643) TaxID=762903 RepID=F0S5R1_PSESL|nr:SusC/RagA family TonB-linked outer membrane protein [Pseudopedobacter saltans]ADY54235.1 TonB-dependent receptor [Pseudopedobacter saltans DSM 12145]
MQIFTKAFRYVLPGIFLTWASQQLSAQVVDTANVSISSADSVALFNKKVSNLSKFNVKGHIKDAATGKALEGISVSLPGFSATITNDKGYFFLPVSGYDATIIIQNIGFSPKEIALKGRKEIEISLLDEEFNSVFDLVTMPMKKVTKSNVPYAIGSINANDVWQRGMASPDSYLQGKISGVNAIRRSGTPGMGANVLIRGFNSMNASNQPLYIVDGVIYDNSEFGISLTSGHSYNPLQDIDIKDIDNITVLKDASAAIYGTRGANGVILINTLRAKEQATKIDFAAYGGFNQQPKNTPVMDAGKYKIYLADVLKTTRLTQSQIESLPFFNDSKENNPDYYRYHYDTNWQDQVMRNSYNQNYYLKVTGGDNIATYGLSLGYLKNEGVIRGTDLTRYQTRFNADLNLSQRVKAFANLSFTSNNQNLKDVGISRNTNPLYLAQIKAPFLSTQVVDNNGEVSPNLAEVDIFNRSNPVSLINNAQNIDNNYRFLGSFGLNYMVRKNLNLQSIVGVTFDKVREKIFIPSKGVVSDTLSKAVAYNRSGSYVSRLYSLYNDTRLNYSKSFDQRNELSANIGFRYNINKSETDYGLGYNSATDEFVSITSGQAALRKVGGMNGDWNWLNVYGNVDYSYAKKYIASLNVAMDGSSRFGKQADGFKLNGNQYAVLPSIGLAWLISSEDFMANLTAIDILKLRGSYGLTGNYDIGNYSAQKVYISQSFLGVQGLVSGNIGNPYLKWETVTKSDLGLEASLINERLGFSIDIFKNKADNLIVYEPVESSTGFKYAVTNNGAMENTGFDFTVNSRIVNKDIKWDLSVNISKYKNKVTKIPNGSMTHEFAGATYLTKVGEAANLFYGYRTNGVYATSNDATSAGLSYRNSFGDLIAFGAGDVKFIDKNKDGVIDDADREVIGNPNPDFVGGIGSILTYKNWSVDALFTFSKGNDIYNFARRELESMNNYNNQTLAVINRWRTEGQQTDMPKASYGDPAGNARFSDRWIEDGSYFRLKTASISYNLTFKNSAIKYTRVYLTGNNIFTLSRYLGADPEFSAGNGLFNQGVDINMEPQFRSVQLGIRVGL